MIQSTRRRVAKGEGFKLDGEAQKFLIWFIFQDDGVSIEIRVKKGRHGRVIEPIWVNKAKSIVDVSKEP